METGSDGEMRNDTRSAANTAQPSGPHAVEERPTKKS
jgi:hypothetical protein